MIFDTLSRFGCYSVFTPGATSKILDALSRLTPETPDGRIEIDGDRIYASVDSYESADFAARQVEAHQDYCDIQLLLSGAEDIFLTDTEELEVTVPYKPDIIFYGQNGAAWSSVRLVPRKFALLFPGEGHMPCIAVAGKPAPVRKVVVKVDSSLLVK